MSDTFGSRHHGEIKNESALRAAVEIKTGMPPAGDNENADITTHTIHNTIHTSATRASIRHVDT